MWKILELDTWALALHSRSAHPTMSRCWHIPNDANTIHLKGWWIKSSSDGRCWQHPIGVDLARLDIVHDCGWLHCIRSILWHHLPHKLHGHELPQFLKGSQHPLLWVIRSFYIFATLMWVQMFFLCWWLFRVPWLFCQTIWPFPLAHCSIQQVFCPILHPLWCERPCDDFYAIEASHDFALTPVWGFMGTDHWL